MTEPEKVLMPRYRCTHCRRSWSNQTTARKHAERCWYDPTNRGCKTCVHFQRGFSETDTGYTEADSCAIEVPFPVVVSAHGREHETLNVRCDGHELLDLLERSISGRIVPAATAAP